MVPDQRNYSTVLRDVTADELETGTLYGPVAPPGSVEP
jgi:hypothetical protein